MASHTSSGQKPIAVFDLLQGILDISVPGVDRVAGVTQDSRRLVQGGLFLALAGVHTDACRYVRNAIDRGASLVLIDDDSLPCQYMCDKTYCTDSCQVFRVQGLRSRVGDIFARVYGNVSRSMPVIGVTGTNGKTSVTHFIAASLAELESKPQGIVGTLGTGIVGALQPAMHTTPDVEAVHRILRAISDAGGQSVSMEVSSHALIQGRVDGVQFDGAVFTNLSRDHLDYHGSMEAYLAAKSKLMLASELNWVVINADDQYCQRIMPRVKAHKCLRFGMQNPDVDLTVQQLSFSRHGMSGYLVWQSERYPFSVNLLGRFNIYNLLATVGVLLNIGIAMVDIVPVVQKLKTVAGRMEVLEQSDSVPKPLVVIDYAHTPEALNNALTALRAHSDKRIWCLFGCGGDRDDGKRQQMGAVAYKFADRVMVTTDNPRSEDPAAIIEQIVSGMGSLESCLIEPNRQQAISLAINQATSEDIVLIAGKGHEDYQEIKGQRLPFSDSTVAREVLSNWRGV